MNNITFPSKIPVVALIGPTAIGKTALSIDLAKRFDFEIISVDSMQVYKYMDIGTAKITHEEMQGIAHHLIDVVAPDQSFDAIAFEKHALEAIKDIRGRGKRVLLTGGSGLYLKALTDGLSHQIPAFPEIRAEILEKLEHTGTNALHELLHSIDSISAKRIHENDTHRLVRGLEIYYGTGKTWSQLLKEHVQSKRVRFENILTVGLTCDRKLLYKRIGLRSEIMMRAGFEEEVVGLLLRGYGLNHKSMRSIGYSHMVKYLQEGWSQERMMELLTRDTRRYAKRQYTWFKKIEDIQWVDKGGVEKIPFMLQRFFNTFDQGDITHF